MNEREIGASIEGEFGCWRVRLTRESEYSVQFEIRRHAFQDEDDSIFASGFVKWDGCVNLEFPEQACMHHFCEDSELLSVGLVLTKARDAALVLMGREENV